MFATMYLLSTDFELLERWRGGDAKAGNDLFRRHFRSLYRFFRSKCPGAEDDLIQATFLACVRARDRFRGDSSFRTYLYKVARHELYGHLRRRAARPNLDFSVTSLSDLASSPSERIDKDQRRAALVRALQSLPLDQQLILELYYWEDVAAVEQAKIFEVTASTARTRLQRAREALRAALERDARLRRARPAGWAEDLGELDRWARSLRGEAGDELE